MKRWLLISLFTSLGCAGGPTTTDAVDDDQVGTLQLSLSGADAEGQSYRLRAATFSINGTRYDNYTNVSTSVSSEDHLESPTLRTRLFYGSYTVSLAPDGWYIERTTADGAERVERAVLLSPASQNAYVNAGGVTPLAFQFGVDGELIDFIGGDLDIGITVRRAPDAGMAP